MEDSGTQIKITDESKTKYSFFKDKKTGGQTVAWEQFQLMKVGDLTGIGYNDNPNPKNPAFPFHNIVNFTPPNYAYAAAKNQPVAQTPTPALKAVPSANSYATEPKSQEFWDERGRRLALHGFINARLQNHTIKEVSEELVALLALEDDVNKILDKKIEFDDITTPTDAPPEVTGEDLPF